MTRGQQAIEIARAWLGTPFVEGASVQGVGADCAGLIEGIARQLGVPYPSRPDVEADFERAARQALVPVPEPVVGGLILLGAQPGGPARHGAIVTEGGTLIHAHWRAGVVENRFGSWFKARLTHCFAWPEAASQKDN
jgi:NlpC/P60 family putative phage cell wall peptidase